jgi:hypothetical protein
MIKNDIQYKNTKHKIKIAKLEQIELKKMLAESSFTQDQEDRALEPIQAFYQQFEDEVAYYEYLKAGNLPELNLNNLGKFLIELRIARGISEIDLADSLKLSVTDVERNEYNEYHGISIQRWSIILKAINKDLADSFKIISY